MEEIKRLIEIGVEKIKSSFRSEDKALFNDFIKVYNQNYAQSAPVCMSCPDPVTPAFGFMEVQYRNSQLKHPNHIIDPKKRFRIRGGGTIQLPHETLTDFSLTDERALEMLRENIRHLQSFDPAYLPANLKELIEGKAEEKKEEVAKTIEEQNTELTKSELMAIAKDLDMDLKESGRMNKADLTEAIKVAKAAKA